MVEVLKWIKVLKRLQLPLHYLISHYRLDQTDRIHLLSPTQLQTISEKSRQNRLHIPVFMLLRWVLKYMVVWLDFSVILFTTLPFYIWNSWTKCINQNCFTFPANLYKNTSEKYINTLCTWFFPWNISQIQFATVFCLGLLYILPINNVCDFPDCWLLFLVHSVTRKSWVLKERRKAEMHFHSSPALEFTVLSLVFVSCSINTEHLDLIIAET